MGKSQSLLINRGAAAGKTTKAHFTWMVGGQQGEGIDSTGDIVARALHRQGYFVYGYRHFASRIKGGHTNYALRVGTREMRCGDDGIDLLIAFDRDSIEVNGDALSPDATVVYDSTRLETPPVTAGTIRLVGLPFTGLAKEAGSAIMKNMVAVGATAALLGLPTDGFAAVIADRFRAKGDEIVGRNRNALETGFRRAGEELGIILPAPIPEPNSANPRLYLSGNEAVALGALAGGCRLLAAYPITPATEIMYWLIEHLPEVGGVVVQCEDEIAAMNMAIGANFAGVRAMTSTSGPGLSLMTEALSLAGMVETPLVLVDVQRAGPATGLPTKTEQGDLNHLLFAGHGEFPRIVLAPRTVEDCFAFTVLAFNLAERYQCPVLIASDLVLGMSRQTIRGISFAKATVERPPFDGVTARVGRPMGDGGPDGAALSDAPPGAGDGDPRRAAAAAGAGLEDGAAFSRYRVTPSGVSPRSRPGVPGRRYLATGDEHDEKGRISEDPANRTAQMDKRLRKLDGLDLAATAVHFAGPAAADLTLVGWGSTFGVLAEVQERLEGEGWKVAHLHLGILRPFPADKVNWHLKGSRRLLFMEQNATGQLFGLMRREICPLPPADHLRKYDGNPFRLAEVEGRCREVLSDVRR